MFGAWLGPLVRARPLREASDSDTESVIAISVIAIIFGSPRHHVLLPSDD
jgi:hypothetical protein